MFNQSVNEFYTRLLFKIDALPQDVAFPLDIAATLFNNLSPNSREFSISDEVQVYPRPPTEKNHQGNHRLLLVINAPLGALKKTRTIKLAVQLASRIRYPRTFVVMLWGNPSSQLAGLGSSFQSEESNSMIAEVMEEYALTFAESAYEDQG